MKTMTNITYPAFALFALACFALSPQAGATCQDACLTNNNTVQGDNALISLTTGTDNTAIGFNALYTDTISGNNTAVGSYALYSDTIGGGDNTATGAFALQANASGFGNTAIGSQALLNSTTGIYNTATGYFTLYHNTTGSYNTATGIAALASNTTGYLNTATGANALDFNTIGIGNAAYGFEALYSNTGGDYNIAIGFQALYRNTTGLDNTAIGLNALWKNSGSFNIALGYDAGLSLTTGRYNIDIGNKGVAAESNTIRIGTTGTQTNAYIAGISGATVPTGVAVIIDGDGHLGTTTSSARFKDEIKPMDKASEAILALKPITFHYSKDLDPKGIPQFGLVAEDVEKVNPDLVARDEEGKPYTVRYEAVNAMLLNEFIKEHRKNEQQRKDFEAALAQQQKQIQALTAVVQKVSARIESSKPAAQTVLNDQ
jgi:hypothetical protein